VVVTCKDGGVGGLFGVGGVFYPSPIQLTTNATGRIGFSYKLPPKPRAVTITCASLGYISALFNETSAVGPPVRMSIVSGKNKTAAPNTPLPATLVVKVADANGYGVPGVTVNFTDHGAGGTFVASSVITSSIGTAAARYTTGANTGTVTITASTARLKALNLKVTVQ
jgi:hypothetical protein